MQSHYSSCYFIIIDAISANKIQDASLHARLQTSHSSYLLEDVTSAVKKETAKQFIRTLTEMLNTPEEILWKSTKRKYDISVLENNR